jgi:hypothetical protein
VWVRQDPFEIIAVADKGSALVSRRERRADVLAAKRRQQDVADIIGQFVLGVPKRRVICRNGVRAGRDRLAEAYQKVVELADLVVDARGQQTSVDQSACDRLGLVGSPLVPEATADERRERNDGGDHQAQ